MQKTFTAFQRQLNKYGFSRFEHGKDEGSYHHSCFTNQEPDLVQHISRSKTHGRSVDKRRDEATAQQEQAEDAHEWDDEDEQDSSKSSTTDHDDHQQTMVKRVVSPSNSPRHLLDASESEPSHAEGSTDMEGDEHTEASSPTFFNEYKQLKTCEEMGWDPSELEPTPFPDNLGGRKGYLLTLVDPELKIYTLQLWSQGR